LENVLTMEAARYMRVSNDTLKKGGALTGVNSGESLILLGGE